MVSTYTSYQLISRNLDRSQTLKSEEAQVANEIEYFNENIKNIETIDEFIGNYRIFNFAMKAFGLEDMTYAKAYMRKVLEEGVTDEDSFANSLTDERFKEFATAFDFKGYGTATTQRTAATTEVVDLYVTQTLEEDAEEDYNEGVRLALYFERKAGEINSYYDILADKALYQVIQTTFGLSEYMSNVDVEQQARLLEKVVDLEVFQDPEEVANLTRRYTAVYDATENTESDPVLALFDNSTSTTLDTSLIMTLQNIKNGIS